MNDNTAQSVVLQLTFSIFLSLLRSPCVSNVAKLSVFGVDKLLSVSAMSINDDDVGSTLPIAFNRSSTVIYSQQYHHRDYTNKSTNAENKLKLLPVIVVQSISQPIWQFLHHITKSVYEQQSPAVAEEDMLQPIQFLLQHRPSRSSKVNDFHVL